MAAVWVFVNVEDEGGKAVGIVLEGAEIVEVEDVLYPMVEFTPENALKIAEALVEVAGRIVKGDSDT